MICIEVKFNIKENYKIIEGYTDTYIITEFGNVYCYRDASSKKGWKGLRKLALRGINNPNRYLSVCLSDAGKKQYIQVHRLVGKYFVDGYFEGAVINHKDKNIHNNNYQNLEWVTQKDNIHYSYSTMNQIRNYKLWKIKYPNGEYSKELKGANELKKYITDNKLELSYSSLRKYGHSNNFELIEI